VSTRQTSVIDARIELHNNRSADDLLQKVTWRLLATLTHHFTSAHKQIITATAVSSTTTTSTVLWPLDSFLQAGCLIYIIQLSVN